MPIVTFNQLRDNIGSTVRETQIESLIGTFINLTLEEIHNFHPWSWLRRKTTFATVASQEEYNLDEEVGRIAILRQRTSPTRLRFVPDRLFYTLIPNPEDLATGNPLYYRIWEVTGFSTNTSQDETLTVVSSSASDTSSFSVQIVGRDTNGLIISENRTLNGTTNVVTATTWDSGGLMQISKSARTTGTITVTGTTSTTTLTRMAPNEMSPRFRRIGLYPIPSSAITMNLEYYERLRLLVADSDVPQMDHQYNWLLREGTLAKVWEYKQNEQASALHQLNFDRGLRLMRNQDESNLDFVPVLAPRVAPARSRVVITSDSLSDNEPSYALAPW